MPENLTLKEYMKEDAFLFDNISTSICKDKNADYELILKQCKDFEENIVLFKILPSFYVMKTILCFKLQDWETAHKYINGSLKYLVYLAKNGTEFTPIEKENFDEYKSNVLDQYKILTLEKPEYLNNKQVSLPNSVKFVTTNDKKLIENEINIRIAKRK